MRFSFVVITLLTVVSTVEPQRRGCVQTPPSAAETRRYFFEQKVLEETQDKFAGRSVFDKKLTGALIEGLESEICSGQKKGLDLNPEVARQWLNQLKAGCPTRSMIRDEISNPLGFALATLQGCREETIYSRHRFPWTTPIPFSVQASVETLLEPWTLRKSPCD